MQELQELINVISKHKIKQIEVIGNENDQISSKFNQFYEILSEGLVDTDEEAKNYLYSDGTSSNVAYNKLKNRFKTRLLNTLFFIDVNQPQFTDIERAFVTCNRNWLAARTLLSRGANKSAMSLAESTIREALRYEFTELIIYLSKMLFWHYSLSDGNPKKYEHYLEVYDRAQEDLQAETLAERYYSEIMLQFASSQAKGDNEDDQLTKYSVELLQRFAHIKSFRFIRISYLLHIIREQIQSNYYRAIDRCKEAIAIIESKPYESQGALFSFNLRLLSCLIQVKEYSEAEEMAIHYSKKLPSGSYNWYVVQYYHFLLHTHASSYQKAYDVLITAIEHKKFNSLFEGQRQLWLVNQAYIQFLIAIGTVKENTSHPKFRLYKFLNDIPMYSKDKRGVNISILIVHVLFLLQQGKYSDIIDRVDALNQYCHRYLRRDDTFRSNCFVKMLLQMAKADFNRIRTERYAQKYWDKLIASELNVASQGIEVEVIPYERLWEIALELLD